MSTDFTLQATGREDTGKGASRRLRRLAGEVPAIVYGGKKDPAMLTLLHKDVVKALENEAFYSHIVSLDIDGKSEDVILKDVQRHPAKQVVLHLDFLRVNKTTKLQTKVPLHFINEDSSIGVKTGGGTLTHNMTEVEITCLPGALPEYIEVDMAEVAAGVSIHLSDLIIPEGVAIAALASVLTMICQLLQLISPKQRQLTKMLRQLMLMLMLPKAVMIVMRVQAKSKLPSCPP